MPMSARSRRNWSLLGALAGLLLAAPVVAGDKDAIAQGAKADAAAGIPAPGFLETRAIAEEGFVYGLPIVMNYAVMYDYVIDRNSGQWKAPFNELFNEHRVFTYEDTSIPTPNSDTPYSLAWMDLRAEPPSILPPGEGTWGPPKIQVAN